MNLTQRREGARTQRVFANASSVFALKFMLCLKHRLKYSTTTHHVKMSASEQMSASEHLTQFSQDLIRDIEVR